MDTVEKTAIILTIVGAITAGVMISYGQSLMNDEIEKMKQRWQAEHDAVMIMNCQQLHDGLLHDTILASDNQQLASNHYVANCGDYKP